MAVAAMPLMPVTRPSPATLLGIPKGARPIQAGLGFPDAGGAGLWLQNIAVTEDHPEDGVMLKLLSGGEPVTVKFTQNMDGTGPGLKHGVEFRVQGGGVVAAYLVNGSLQYARVTPDGKVTPLPAPTPPKGGTRYYFGMLADGTLCGLDRLNQFDRNYFCRAPDGSERSKPVGANQPCLTYNPLPDGSWVGPCNGGGTGRFDPVSLSATIIDPRDLVTISTAADGTVWGMVRKSLWTAVKVTPTGLQDIVVPQVFTDYFAHGNPNFAIDVVPDETMLLFDAHVGWSSIIPRLLRP